MKTPDNHTPDQTLTVFANFRINDTEALQRMKDSFYSFKDIGVSKWVINIRGKHKMDALCFLHGQLQEQLLPHLIESEQGWFADSRTMLAEIDSDYVLFWIEDHINMADVTHYREILRDMAASETQVMRYSWWRNGMLADIYSQIEKKDYPHIKAFDFHVNDNEAIQKRFIAGVFILDCVSIYRLDLFRKLILTDDPIPPRRPKETPYDFEKNGTDNHWLPLKMAIPKYELFASIDEDMGVFGTSLQSRGLYPRRVTRPKTELEVTIETFSDAAIKLLKEGVAPNDVQKQLEMMGLKSDTAQFLVSHCGKYCV